MNVRPEIHAADWLARRNGGLSAAEQAELAAWLACDPRHAAAFSALEHTWSRLNEPRRAGCAEQVAVGIDTLRRQRARRRQAAWSALGLAAAIAVISAVYLPSFRPLPPATPAATHRPAIRTLDDGSKVALRSGAAIEVDFRPALRRVNLVRGEALFSVARDPARPFVVRSGEIEVRAVGTEFAVARAADTLTVLVTEGRIAVTRTRPASPGDLDPPPPTLYAGAGERLIVPATLASGRQPTTASIPATVMAQALAWRGERLEFAETPLATAVRLINQGQRIQVLLADPELGQRTVTGVLWADDNEGFVRLLEKGFDLVAEREGDVIRLRARP